jgi:hypothetical protein
VTEKIIRVLALLLGLAVAACYYAQTKNGHYQYIEHSNLLLNTRTGDLYRPDYSLGSGAGRWKKVVSIAADATDSPAGMEHPAPEKTITVDPGEVTPAKP